MKLTARWLVATLAGLLLLQACKPDEQEAETGTLTVNFVPTANNQPFALGQGYTSIKGLPYKFDLFKFYVSNFALYNNGVNDTVLDADLISYSLTVPHKSFTVNVKPGSYSGFQFGLGVDSLQNKYDPTSFPTNSPFSASQGTHWGMFLMYRFVMLEGAIDTTDDGLTNYELPIIAHTGFDSLYRTRSFGNFPIEIVKGKNTTINVNFDVNRVFYNNTDTVNLMINHITHTSDNMGFAKTVMNNLSNAFEPSN